MATLGTFLDIVHIGVELGQRQSPPVALAGSKKERAKKTSKITPDRSENTQAAVRRRAYRLKTKKATQLLAESKSKKALTKRSKPKKSKVVRAPVMVEEAPLN